ncbi:unnamed protein product [marine sediment metagenome]|uniref:Uncharacterized protein n=1 Tax=marine sediment metagenome TaxID=412755 RepID=X1RWD0_9ZZZZ
MAELGPSMKPIVMPHYPHMMAEDIVVWSKYLQDPLVPIREVWYDVHVGGAVPVAGGPETMESRIAAGITRKRIDVVCAVGGGFWVVEIKPFASMLALGQVLSYTRLFKQEFAPVGEVWPVIVCDRVDDDLLAEFDAAGVAVIVND